jgi:hypothetical protein
MACSAKVWFRFWIPPHVPEFSPSACCSNLMLVVKVDGMAALLQVSQNGSGVSLSSQAFDGSAGGDQAFTADGTSAQAFSAASTSVKTDAVGALSAQVDAVAGTSAHGT